MKKIKRGSESKTPMVEDAETWRGAAIADDDAEKLRFLRPKLGILRRVREVLEAKYHEERGAVL